MTRVSSRNPAAAGRRPPGAGSSRRAGTTASTEDYLAAIYDLAGSGGPVFGARLARHLKFSAPAVTEALQRLQRAGYLRLAPDKEIALTRRGRTLAAMMARRHRLIERWLTDVLGLDWIEAHEEAHRLEHALSPRVENRLAALLGMPSTCPHGNPIPGMAGRRGPRCFPLDQAGPGMTVVVERITEEAEADRKLLEHLWRSGIRPGTRLLVEEVAPWAGTVSTSSDGRPVVLGLPAAGKIWVYEPGSRSRRAGASALPGSADPVGRGPTPAPRRPEPPGSPST